MTRGNETRPEVPPLQSLLDRQSEAWSRGERLAVEAIIAIYPNFRDDQILAALISNEIALREARGESPDWEEYRHRFPDLNNQSLPFLHAERAIQLPTPIAHTDDTTGLLVALRDVLSPRPKVEPPPTGSDAVPGYEILDELGRGGMGVVYKARQKSLNRIVALKMILSGGHANLEALTRFRLEAEAVSRLRHPNIVQIFDVGECDGRPYFSLEFVEGGSLDRRLDRTTLSAPQAASLVEMLARAMQSAHEQGIVHRDLKPANVLLTTDGAPKITDFGLAKQMDNDTHQTQTGAVMGTPSYMAPEQAEGRLDVIGPATDVYALGAILYCALTGRPPFKGATTRETLNQVINDEPLPPSRLQAKVPRDLETICLKCLAKPVRKRYSSAVELAEDLHHFIYGEPIRARAVGRTERVWRWCRRNPVPASLLITVVMGAIFGMWYLSQLSQDVVRKTALESAAHQAEMYEQLNDFYSEEIVKRSGIKATHNYKNEPHTIPSPATLTIDLGEYISDHSQLGQQVRVYSDIPFLHRQEANEGGPRDEFERRALAELRRHPDESYHEFAEIQNRPVLRYATARRMKASCVSCHNTHPLSPKTDWKVGEVRGVLEIIRPLDVDQRAARSGLRGTFILIAGFCTALLVFSLLVLALGRKTRRPL